MAAPAQLQRATRELQAALLSVRRRRRSMDEVVTGEKLGGSAEIGREGQENDAGRRNARECEELDAKRDVERGASRAEPWRGMKNEDRGDLLGISQLSAISGLSGIVDLGDSDSDEWSVEEERAVGDNEDYQKGTQSTMYSQSNLEDEARKALSWIQADVERQARANKETAGHLVQGVQIITNAIEEVIPGVESCTDMHDMLSLRRSAADQSSMPKIIDAIVAQWKQQLNKWAKQQDAEREELSLRFLSFRDECESRLKGLEASHRHDCDQLQQHADFQRLQSDRREMTYEDERGSLSKAIEDMREYVETSERQLMSFSKSLHQSEHISAIHGQHLQVAPVSATVNEQETIKLTAQLKEADLRVLRWQMAFEEQTEINAELEARLQMTLEEQQAREESVKFAMQDMVSRQHVETYRERIGWLEEHVHDMESQIACDREQFAFDVARWEQEKLDARKELDEIRDVSVKLLKVLLIREKLSKKREQEHADRIASLHERFGATKHAMQSIAKKLMEESAALLLCLQQTVVHRPNSEAITPCTQSGVITPAQVRAMIKQLKRLDRGLNRLDFYVAMGAPGEDSVSTDSAMSDPDWAVHPAGDFGRDAR